MPYADNQGVRVHYKVEGDGPPLVLQHGFTQNLERWYECGYVDQLKPHFRLILIDARGHGGSDKPHEHSAYAWPAMVDDVAAVLDSLDLRKASFWGYSMGGGIGFGILQAHPDRIGAIVIGGSSASAQDARTGLGHVDGRDPEAFVSALEKLFGANIAPAVKARLLASDTQALAAAAPVRPSLENILPAVATPSLLYVGERDVFFPKAQATAKLMQRASFVPLPGLNHAEAFMRSDLVVPVVKDFLDKHVSRS
jgi:pimeloyl-ACP methyl ester carboxylesterase